MWEARGSMPRISIQHVCCCNLSANFTTPLLANTHSFNDLENSMNRNNGYQHNTQTKVATLWIFGCTCNNTVVHALFEIAEPTGWPRKRKIYWAHKIRDGETMKPREASIQRVLNKSITKRHQTGPEKVYPTKASQALILHKYLSLNFNYNKYLSWRLR